MRELLPEVLITPQNLKDKKPMYIQVQPVQEFSLEPLQHVLILPDEPPVTTLNLMNPPTALPYIFFGARVYLLWTLLFL